MASTVHKFRRRAEIINDLDVLVLMQFMREVVLETQEYAGLRTWVEGWTKSIEEYGPGVLHLRLEEALTSTRLQQVFVRLMADVRRRLARYGEKIPATLLNSVCRPSGVEFSDYPVSLIENAAERLAKLVEIEPESSG